MTKTQGVVQSFSCKQFILNMTSQNIMCGFFLKKKLGEQLTSLNPFQLTQRIYLSKFLTFSEYTCCKHDHGGSFLILGLTD